MTLAQLDLGEAETITLATEMHAEVLLMDEWPDGRKQFGLVPYFETNS